MARASTGKILANDGTPLMYRRWPGKQGRPVLLFVHGLGEHSGRYQYPVRYFHALGYNIYSYDQRGHGQSGGVRAYAERFARFVGDLDCVLRLVRSREGDKKVILIGHSFGGQVVLTYGARFPSKISGAISSSANLRLAMPISWIKKQLGLLLARYAPKLTMDAGIDPKNISHDPQVVADYESDPLINCQITVRLASEMFANQDQIMGLARAFRLPCFMMHGGDDPISDPKGTKDFYKACASKDKSLKIYPGLYHEIFNEVDRKAVFDDMKSWLEKRI